MELTITGPFCLFLTNLTNPKVKVLHLLLTERLNQIIGPFYDLVG